MITNAISGWHYAYIGNGDVGGHPYAVDWLLAAKVCGAYFLPCVFSDCFYHPQAFWVHQHPSYCFRVDVLVRVQANYQPVPCCPPILKKLS